MGVERRARAQTQRLQEELMQSCKLLQLGPQMARESDGRGCRREETSIGAEVPTEGEMRAAMKKRRCEVRREGKRRAVAQTRKPREELMRSRKRLQPRYPKVKGGDDGRYRRKLASEGDQKRRQKGDLIRKT